MKQNSTAQKAVPTFPLTSNFDSFFSLIKEVMCVEMASTWQLELRPRFRDATVEQTQMYGSQRGHGSHLLLRKSSFLAVQMKGTWPLGFSVP